MVEQDVLSQLVVVGSSAGGIEALSILLGALPSDFPAPVVIAQHLDPQRPSHLNEILARNSKLPVKTILDAERLQPGTVYVVPADRSVHMEDGLLRLVTEPPSYRPQPSINLLFSSAAKAFGEGLISVILTGTGSDGAAGAQQVRQAGGTVIVQNPSTALFPGMPLSLAPTTVDMVADIEQIGPLLYDLVTGSLAVTHRRETKAMNELMDYVHEHSGLDFTQYRMPTIIRRLKRRMIAQGVSSLVEYQKLVKRDPAEYQRLLNSLLIKVTEFFRDQPVFDALRRDVLPKLIDYARHHTSELRVWSAGCATGEEAYSLAMFIAEALGDDQHALKVTIFATDADPDAIAFARRGIYSNAALRHVPEHMLTKYFMKHDGEYSAGKRIRGMIIFGEHDLARRAPFPRIDLVLCRNVLIYFTTELQKRVIRLFAYSLRDGGYLVLGKVETVSMQSHTFAVVDDVMKFYCRQGERFLLTEGDFDDAAHRDSPAIQPRPILVPPVSSPHLPRASTARPRTSVEWLGGVMLGLPVGIVLVDRHYDVQVINRAALHLLDIRRAAIGEDLLHLAESVPTRELRDVIDTALRGQQVTPIITTLAATSETGEPVYLQILAIPNPSDDPGVPIANVLLQVTDVTSREQEQQVIEQQLAGAHQSQAQPADKDAAQRQADIDHLREQARQLTMVNRELRDANHDLNAANLGLRHLQEEMQVQAEELQASNEEVETLNEELQASNEELETLNEELQATVEELNTLNGDMEAQARQSQASLVALQEHEHAAETERGRAEAILESMSDAVLVVDRTGMPIFKNKAYERIFGVNALIAEDDQGRPLPPEDTPQQRARRGEPFTMVVTHVNGQGKRGTYEASGRPILHGGVANGSVIVIRDVTDRKPARD
ncbi:MAG TPA: CheR family methyltransferase [Ktedonobacterales bacterium]